MYVNDEICETCGGKCCKDLPGGAHPEDFGMKPGDHLAPVVALLKSGDWSFDCWENYIGCRDGWYLRPATKERQGQWFDRSWGGECVFLDDGGCSLDEDKRPYGCRHLEPRVDLNCIPHAGGKKDCADAWAPWHDEIDNLREESE